MGTFRTPWFPGKFGSGDHDRTGDDTSQPYAPPSAHESGTNPYGDDPGRPDQDSVTASDEAGAGWLQEHGERHAEVGQAPGTAFEWEEPAAFHHGPDHPDIPMRTGRDDPFPPATETEAAELEARRRLRRYYLYATMAGLAILAVLLGIVLRPDGEPASGPKQTTPPPATTPTAPAEPPPTLPPPEPAAGLEPLPGEMSVDESVHVGPFDVEVIAVAAGLTELGEDQTVTADGEFIVVRLSVTADQAGIFLDIDQSLLDSDGTEHEPHRTASAAVVGNGLFLADLDAGEDAEGVIVFDVESGTEPAALLVRAAEGDDAVSVPLD